MSCDEEDEEAFQRGLEERLAAFDKIAAFKKYHPMGRLYEIPTDIQDKVGNTCQFEIMDWKFRMKCVKVENGISHWKRIYTITFGNEKC